MPVIVRECGAEAEAKEWIYIWCSTSRQQMLSFAQPSFTVVKQGPDKHLLVSVCVHGDETCGLASLQ